MEPFKRLKELLGVSKVIADETASNVAKIINRYTLNHNDIHLLKALNGDWGLNILNIITAGVYVPGDLGQACRTAIADLNAIGKPEMEPGVDWWGLWLKNYQCPHSVHIDGYGNFTIFVPDESYATKAKSLQETAENACRKFGIEPEV